ncbi:hypothetical protein [Pseudomonas sp. PDM19]|uniref:hypothetical protein n=1 Tax=Pseudomonas sp. PDM19 TaxID=2769272 RepID=UPI0017873996|nr:hypothetical protein [Pseudomonas sp. PDM19]MBD9629788.1 hypothetical protein [Pseudomonas sp. PDM19]
MSRDKVIFLGCLCLFAAGAVWGKVLPSIELSEFAVPTDGFWSFKIVDVFQMVSGLATAFAAFAAWKSAVIAKDSATIAKLSADTAKRSADESRNFSMLQAYSNHRDRFDKFLDQTESDLGIRFENRERLYRDIFPNNGKPGCDLQTAGHGVELAAWKKRYKELSEHANSRGFSSERDFISWAVDTVALSGNYLRYRLELGGKKFIWADGLIKTYLVAGSSSIVLHTICEVLRRLEFFALGDDDIPYVSPTSQVDFWVRKIANDCILRNSPHKLADSSGI